jgi:GNAT superfamily N-acetyltransferase
MELRDAGTEDLGAIYDVWRATQLADSDQPPPDWPDGPGTMPWFAHLLEVGRLIVAVDDGSVVGFAGLLDHGRCVALSDLFVAPSRQSAGIGGLLLDVILPTERSLVTMASTDPRAVASYVRRGMRPRWPAYYLGADVDRLRAAPRPAVSIAPTNPDEYPWELRGDAEHYAGLGGTTARICAGDEPIGTALLLRGNPQRVFHPEATEILESAAATEEDAADVVLGLVQHLADGGAERIELQVPGPHPALAPLLARGFEITDVDMACASERGLLADPGRYTMHGEARVAGD